MITLAAAFNLSHFTTEKDNLECFFFVVVNNILVAKCFGATDQRPTGSCGRLIDGWLAVGWLAGWLVID